MPEKPNYLVLRGAGLPRQPETRIQVPGNWNTKTAESYAAQLWPNAIITEARLEPITTHD